VLHHAFKLKRKQ